MGRARGRSGPEVKVWNPESVSHTPDSMRRAGCESDAESPLTVAAICRRARPGVLSGTVRVLITSGRCLRCYGDGKSVQFGEDEFS